MEGGVRRWLTADRMAFRTAFGQEKGRALKVAEGKRNRLDDVLMRHGVHDAFSALEAAEDGAVIKPSPNPEVRTHGSVEMARNRIVDRRSVRERFSRLKHL